MTRIKTGQRFGQWVTTGPEALGSGGNGDVWRSMGTTAAMERSRFLRAAAALKAHIG
jgi:hypothetical protein